MAHSAGGPSDLQRLIDHDEVDTLFATANPNPERIGCPPKATLAEFARRERDLEDPGYHHLSRCSPCYLEFRSLQQGRSGTPVGDRSLAWWISVAAAAVLLIAAGAWRYRTEMISTPPLSVPSLVARHIELDLRPYGASRSEQGTTPRPPLTLTSENLEATVLLPTGSEPGRYDAQLRDASSRVLAAASGSAGIRNFVTTLQVSLDLRSISAGDFRLFVRRAGDDWHEYPAVVQ